jgi:tripeptidyl-peptidase-1
MSHEEILAMIAPAQESGDLVIRWLTSELSGPDAKVSQKGDYVTVEASVNEIEGLLDAEYGVFGISTSKYKMYHSNSCSQT